MESNGPDVMNEEKTVTKQPKGNLMLLDNLDGKRKWSSSMFDCCSNPEKSFFTFCCCPWAMCMLSRRVGERCWCPGTHSGVRSKIRTAGGIKGTLFRDLMAVTFCGPCALCQEGRELDSMGIPL